MSNTSQSPKKESTSCFRDHHLKYGWAHLNGTVLPFVNKLVVVIVWGVSLLLILPQCYLVYFASFQQLVTKLLRLICEWDLLFSTYTFHLHIYLFLEVLPQCCVSLRWSIYWLIAGPEHCVMRFAYAFHMRSQNLVRLSSVYAKPFSGLHKKWFA